MTAAARARHRTTRSICEAILSVTAALCVHKCRRALFYLLVSDRPTTSTAMHTSLREIDDSTERRGPREGAFGTLTTLRNARKPQIEPEIWIHLQQLGRRLFSCTFAHMLQFR